MQKNVLKFLKVTVILLTSGITVQAQPTVVTEIPNGSSNFLEAGNFVFFTYSDSLLRTDGTSAGTILLRDGFSAFSALTSSTTCSSLPPATSSGKAMARLVVQSSSQQNPNSRSFHIGSILFFQGSDDVVFSESILCGGGCGWYLMTSTSNPYPGSMW